MYSEENPDNQPPKVVRTKLEARLLVEGRVQYAPTAGGLSGAKIWHCQLQNAAYALRCWPQTGITTERLGWIHEQLAVAYGRGCNFLPVPLDWGAGLTWHGFKNTESDNIALWEVAQWKHGKPLSDGSPMAQQELAVEALAKFHDTLKPNQLVEDNSATVHNRLRRIQECETLSLMKLMRLGVSESSAKRLDKAFQSVRQEVIQKLLSWGLRSFPLQPVQIDSRPEHFLLSDGKVTGLIDFGAMCFDTPAIDLARLVGELSLGNRETQRHLVERYNAVSRQIVDPDFVTLIDRSGAVAGIGNWITWLDKDFYLSKRPIAIEQGLVRIRTLAKRLRIEI